MRRDRHTTHPIPPTREWDAPLWAWVVALTTLMLLTSLPAIDAGGHLARIQPTVADARQSTEFSPLAPPLKVQLVASPSTLNLGNVTGLNALISGGVPWFSFVWGLLPTGCKSSNQSSLNCTPTAAGTFTVSVTVTDSIGKSDTNSTTLVVKGSQPMVSGSPLSLGSIYVFAGLLGIAASVVTALVITMLFRRRRRQPPMVTRFNHPYIPPTSEENP